MLFETPEGPLEVSGAAPALFIDGLLPPPEHLMFLTRLFDAAVGKLPGMGGPDFADTSIAAFTRAYQALVDQHRVTTVVGVSAGCLVALGLRNVELVLVEPFLDPQPLWPLHAMIAQLAREGRISPDQQTWAERILAGDYRGLARGGLTVIWGETALGDRRPLASLPSLVSDEERRLWRASPGVRVFQTPGGHNVPAEAGRSLVQILAALGLPRAGQSSSSSS